MFFSYTDINRSESIMRQIFMFENSKKMSEKGGKKPRGSKKEGRFSKLILGLVVGGAVGSVVGVTLSDKENREKIRKTSVKAFHSSQKFISDMRESRTARKPEKKGFWHFLHRLVHGNKKK